MTQAKPLDGATAVQILSFVLALLLWLSVLVERPGQTEFLVPVRVTDVPAELTVAWPPPAQVEVTVSGPKILLWLLPFRGVSCDLDLQGAAAGRISYVPREADVRLPDEDLKLVRVHPRAIPLTLAPVIRR